MRVTYPFLLLALSVPVSAQAKPAQAFSAEEIAIYRELLLHYPLELGDLSDMEAATVPFELHSEEMGDRSALKDVHVLAPSKQPRPLPREVLSLGDEGRVARLLAAQGKLVPPSRRVPGHRQDGFVATRFSLSEIAFDAGHRFAEVKFRADCGCLGGEGGTALFEHKPTGWQLVRVADVWEG